MIDDLNVGKFESYWRAPPQIFKCGGPLAQVPDGIRENERDYPKPKDGLTRTA
jgi:hypothetical protein